MTYCPILFSPQGALERGEERCGIEDTVDDLAHQRNDRGIDQGGQDRTKSDAVEGGVSDRRPIEGCHVTKERDGEENREREQSHIEAKLDAVDIKTEARHDLRNEQLVYLQGHIGAEKQATPRAVMVSPTISITQRSHISSNETPPSSHKKKLRVYPYKTATAKASRYLQSNRRTTRQRRMSISP